MDDLNKVASEVRKCTLCELHVGRKNAVPGEGPANAEIMLIGEGPGFYEDKQGRPFVGPSGQFLTELLASAGYKREDVFITNVVKCFISPRVLIYTSHGYRPIKDVHVGDLVLTHTGKFRRVVYVHPHEILPKGSPLVRLTIRARSKSSAKPVSVTVTPEHPFLVNGKWKPAGQIQLGDPMMTLGDRCEVCGEPFFVRYDRYEARTYRTCCYRCHNQRVYHNPQTRDKVRQIMHAQYVEGKRDPYAIIARANARTREMVAAGLATAGRWTAEERRRARVTVAQRVTEGQANHRMGFGELEQIVEQPEMVEAALRRLLRNHEDDYVFIEAEVISVEHCNSRRDFPLYNIGVEGDESYVVAGLVSHNCRPPGNRDPLPEEIEACSQYLDRQIALINPKVIVTLGRFSMAKWFPGQKISAVHGKAKRIDGRTVVAMFHPAAALHQPALREAIEADFRKLKQIVAEAQKVAAEKSSSKSDDETGEQLSLF